MKADLRNICRRQISLINELSEEGPLGKEDIEKLRTLASALKTLEDTSGTSEEDDVIAQASLDDLMKLIDGVE